MFFTMANRASARVTATHPPSGTEAGMYEIFKEFTFEAAHHLAVNVSAGHPYAKLHGHSFRVEVFVKGVPDRDKNWLCDFGEIEHLVGALRGELDHNYLN